MRGALQLASTAAEGVAGGRDRRAARMAHEAGRGLAAFGWEPTARGPTAWVVTDGERGRLTEG